jgi:hypothetical protein
MDTLNMLAVPMLVLNIGTMFCFKPWRQFTAWVADRRLMRRIEAYRIAGLL